VMHPRARTSLLCPSSVCSLKLKQPVFVTVDTVNSKMKTQGCRNFVTVFDHINDNSSKYLPFLHAYLTPKEKVRFVEAHPSEKLYKSLTSLTVGNLLLDKIHKDQLIVYDTEEDRTTYDAIKFMSEKDIGCLLVKAKTVKEYVSIFTERDYIRKLVLQGKSSKDTPVRAVASADVITATPEYTMYQSACLMHEKQLRHLPVYINVGEQFDEDSRIVTVFSVRDIMKYIKQCVDVADIPHLHNVNIMAVFEESANPDSGHCFVMPSDTVFEALRKMEKHGMGAVYVKDDILRTVRGVFTERDYLHKLAVQNKSSKTTTVEQVMTPDPVSILPTQSLYECLDNMIDSHIRTMPVVDSDGRIFGILTASDILSHIYKMADRGQHTQMKHPYYGWP